ncbi:MAG TPA: cytochrome P460 family protein [Polyangiaceae bacterium]|nr:cytochrome P460 family protein [Polyangiaceae bacterium]
MEAVGTSTPKGVPATAVDAAAPRPSPVAGDFRKTMARLTDRQVSEGHAERFDAIVWANDAAKGAWDAGSAMPDGAMLVEETIERPGRTDRADKPAGLFVMKKDGGSWSFVVVGPGGDVVDDARVAPCKACHALAPVDYVFKHSSGV